MKKVSLIAAKSGGHIIPCISIANKIIQKDPSKELVFFTSTNKLDYEITKSLRFFTKFYIDLDNFPYKKIWKYPFFGWKFIKAFFKSFFILQKKRPEKIISMGGYISIPVCLAAKTLNIPIELFELNAIPGRTIKFLAPLADKIFICFKESKQYLMSGKCQIIKYPIRYSSKDKRINKNLNIVLNKKTIFFLGGSQGSVFINNLIKKWILKNSGILNKIQIIHQTGSNDKTDWKAFYKKFNIKAICFEYSNDIKEYYLASDLVVSRCGAGTLFEIIFFNKKAIIIPLPNLADSHQKANAEAIKKMRPDLFSILYQEEFKLDNNLLNNLIMKKLF